MKLKYLFYLAIAVLISCDTEDCIFPSNPIPPTGYNINRVGPIGDEGSSQTATDFQMLTNTLGYAMKTGAEARELCKTTNGGTTWTSTPISFEVTLESLLFTDEETGYIAHRGDDNGAFLLKTNNGGETWENLAFPEFPIFFKELKEDENGNLYALLGGFAEYTGLVKSTDEGISWTEIYTTDSPFVSLLTIVDNRIYFKESGDKLQIADLNGNILETLTVEGNEQISVIDEDKIIVVNQYEVNKTTDGGATWLKIFTDEARIIDFSEANGMILLLDQDYCGDNPNELSAFGLGAVNGSMLEASESMTNFEIFSFENAQKIGEGHYLVQMNNEVFELKEM